MASVTKRIFTASHLRYLLALKRLGEGDRGVRCVSIADALGFSKPSVHKMIEVLCRLNLVRKVSRGMVYLTDGGKELAAQYEEYFLISADFFKIVLGLNPEEAENCSYSVLAEVPLERLGEMCGRMREV